MGLPSVTISKNTFSTAVAPADPTGILAIVACSSTGTTNTPGGYSRSDNAGTDYGYGPLPEYFAYNVQEANKPAVLIRGNAGFPGVLGTLTKTLGTGTATVTDSSSAPFDTYNFGVTFLTGGTIGVAGITYKWTTDGYNTDSGAQALGTANSIAFPNTGITLALGAGTIAAGATVQSYTTRPMMNDTDVTNALTPLGLNRIPFEGVLVDCSAGASSVATLDGILSGWEARGMFKYFVLNSRYKTEPEPTAETETAYATALGNLFSTQTSIRGCVGADGAHAPSPITAWNLKRPTSMFLATRAAKIQIGEDPAYVGRGAIGGASIVDKNSNPLDHDEELYPNLDSLRLTSLRSFAPGGPQGVYIGNANVISPSGSAFVYLQHVRILNRACEVAWGILTRQLSRGVRKNLKPDPTTGVVTILEADAQMIDGLVADGLYQPMKGQVTSVKFTLSRTDNADAIPFRVNGLLEIVALAYIKGVAVQAQFSKTISAAI